MHFTKIGLIYVNKQWNVEQIKSNYSVCECVRISLCACVAYVCTCAYMYAFCAYMYAYMRVCVCVCVCAWLLFSINLLSILKMLNYGFYDAVYFVERWLKYLEAHFIIARTNWWPRTKTKTKALWLINFSIKKIFELWVQLKYTWTINKRTIN